MSRVGFGKKENTFIMTPQLEGPTCEEPVHAAIS